MESLRTGIHTSTITLTRIFKLGLRRRTRSRIRVAGSRAGLPSPPSTLCSAENKSPDLTPWSSLSSQCSSSESTASRDACWKEPTQRIWFESAKSMLGKPGVRPWSWAMSQAMGTLVARWSSISKAQVIMHLATCQYPSIAKMETSTWPQTIIEQKSNDMEGLDLETYEGRRNCLKHQASYNYF